MDITTKTVQTFCMHCQMKCRLFVRLVDGRITHIANAMGVEGIRAINASELVYHPDRVIYPLKRRGERGEGKWERISWDEALDIMAHRFGEIKEKYGAEAIATILGSAHKEIPSMATFLFTHLIGTPNNLDINQHCTLPGHIAEMVTIGDRVTWDTQVDYQRSKCILLWGANQRHNRPPMERDINIAQSRGAKLILVDPRPSEQRDLNKQGLPSVDVWLRLRPGTDTALALAMINIIINEGLYNKPFVDKWCIGFEELEERVQEYPPERAEEITWVPKEQIVQAARLFATTKPSCVHARLGTCAQHINATQAGRAIDILLALVGDIDLPGGNLLPHELGGFRSLASVMKILRVAPEVEERRIGAKEYPLTSGTSKTAPYPYYYAHFPACIQAMLNRRIKAFYVPGCNVAVSNGDIKRTWQALKRLEFLVVADFFMTPTAELADLVLPAAHWLETELPTRAHQVMGPRRFNHILALQRVIEPVGECWDDRKIVLELAKRMGIKTPWKSVEEFNDWLLEPVGIKLRDIQRRPAQMISFPIKYRQYEERGFKTPSGKIELHSGVFKKLGYDPLPHYVEPPQSPYSTPDIAKEYPLIMSTHRNIIYTHSEFRQLPSYRKVAPDPIIEINPETATDLGIGDGDEMWIERPGFDGRVKGKAKFVPELHARVVSCVPLWWFPEKTGPEHGCFESNINAIISSTPPYDPISGNYQMRAVLCKVGRA